MTIDITLGAVWVLSCMVCGCLGFALGMATWRHVVDLIARFVRDELESVPGQIPTIKKPWESDGSNFNVVKTPGGDRGDGM
jgi:hypothetical protein